MNLSLFYVYLIHVTYLQYESFNVRIFQFIIHMYRLRYFKDILKYVNKEKYN